MTSAVPLPRLSRVIAQLVRPAIVLACLAAGSIGAPAAARAQGPLGIPLAAGRLASGEWVAYWNLISVPGARRDTLWQRIAVIEPDKVRGLPAHWIEMTLQGPRKKSLIAKLLVLDSGLDSTRARAGAVRASTALRARDPDLSFVARLIIKSGRNEPVELRLPDALPLLRSLIDPGGGRYALEQIVRDDSLEAGEETVETARGTARARHTSFVSVIAPPAGDTTGIRRTYATDVWTSADVPVTGVVRALSRTLEHPPDPGRETERTELILAGYGVGARSHLRGRVRIVTLPQVPLETGVR